MDIKTKTSDSGMYLEVYASSIAEVTKVAEEVRKAAETKADGRRLSDPLIQSAFGRLKVVCFISQ